MKTVLIAASVAVFLVYGFVMYCCIKVGAESEKDYDRLTKGEGKEMAVKNHWKPCKGCPYGKYHPCLGYCIAKILKEVKEHRNTG